MGEMQGSSETATMSLLRARSSMDRIRVSEALDTGSIPVGRAISPHFMLLCFRFYAKYAFPIVGLAFLAGRPLS